MDSLQICAASGKEIEDDIVPQKIAPLRELLGNVVFLPCNQGEGGKGAYQTGWPTKTFADMTQQHLAECERPSNRIGILLGKNSGGLCSVDCDTDDFAAEMLRLNPKLESTLTTACNRGCASLAVIPKRRASTVAEAGWENGARMACKA